MNDVSVVAQVRGDRTVLTSVAGTEPWRPRILDHLSGWARVALVQSRATLIRGDDVRLSIEVGPGAALELVELGALLAHDARDGPEARLSVDITLADDARLVWLGQPLVLAAGCAIDSYFAADLGPRARLLRGESIVLGRAGQKECGVLRSRTRLTQDGVPLLDESMSTADVIALRSFAVVADHKTIAGVALAGTRDPDAPSGVMQAYGAATLWREAGPTIAVTAKAASLARRWRSRLGLGATG